MAKKTTSKSRKQRPARLDIDLVRQAATGRWPEILAHVAGISADVLDGRHHPCPKCGGTDRFRMVDTAAGSLLCNQCFKSRNGDGFAAVQWSRGIDFVSAAREVAGYLGIDATAADGAGAGNSGSSSTSTRKPPPDKHLDWRPWNDTIARLWCRHKPGVTIDGIRAAGGRLARYRGQYTVIAFPVWGPLLDKANPVGWVIVNTTGKALPKFSAAGEVDWITKPKTTYGSAPGILGDLERFRKSAAAWKLEGISDLLAWLSMPDTAPDHAAITNANGCGERPPKWVAELFAGKAAYVLHDADEPGQAGAVGWDDRGRHRPGWAEEIAGKASECRNVRLPYPVAETHGKDFRDWMAEGGTFDKLRALAADAEVVASAKETANEAVDDPYRLARMNLEKYAARTGGRTIRYWQEGWWIWKPCRYRMISEGEFGAKLTASIKEEFDRLNIDEIRAWRERKEAGSLGDDEGKPPVAKKVTPSLVKSVMNATKGMVYLSGEMELNTWIPCKQQRPYIAMANGILDVEALLAGKSASEYMLEHSPDWFSTVQLDYSFDVQAKCPTWNAFLEKNLEMDPERIKLVQEWAGYLLLPDTNEQTFMVLEGEGSNGKSVFCAAIEAMLGQANCSHIQLECFGDRFSKTETVGKLVNICGDAGEIDRVAEGVIKSYTSGNPMFFDKKGQPGFSCSPTARLMIACNNRPRFSDRSQGIYRRMRPVPWRVEIQKHERVRGMDKAVWWKATGELPGIFNWAIAGLHRLRTQGFFTDSQLVTETLEEYKLEMNPARLYLTEHMEKCESTSGVKVDAVYKLYQTWALHGGFKPLSKTQFGREVFRTFKGVVRARRGPKEGRSWCYVGIDFQEGNYSGEDLLGAYCDDF